MYKNYSFPPEYVSPDVKELPEYGLAAVRAMYFSPNRYGSFLYGSDLEYDSLVEIAQGRQSTGNIRRMMGFHRDLRRTSEYDDSPDSMVYLDLQVLNLGTKYVNRAVAKMQQINYDISLEAIDLTSIDEKSDFAASIQAFYRQKEWAQKMGIPLQAAFPGLDIESLPQFQDEFLYDITANPKIKKEIAGELSLKLVQSINRFKQKMRRVDWDMVVSGWGHFHCYQDANGIPRIDPINHKYWGGSYVEDDDFDDQEYSFFLDVITANQFVKEAHPYFTTDEIEQIIKKYSVSNSLYNRGVLTTRAIEQWDNLAYIPVVRFYFRSEDNRAFVRQKGKATATIIKEKPFNFEDELFRRPDLAELFDKGERQLIKNSYTSVYGGCWIVDSPIVYKYGRVNYPRTQLVNASLPIKTFATNFKEGRAVSFTAQMIEPLYMINTAWNKIKEILAKGWDGYRNIDLDAIEAVAMGKGGNVWTPKQVIEFMNMSNTVVGRRRGSNPYGQSNGDIVTFQNSGVELPHYFTMLTTGINMLEQMTATPITESSDVPDRLPAKFVQQSKSTGDLDMEYLFNAHEYLYERVSHTLLLLTQQATRDKVIIKDFIPALGKVHTGFYQVPKDIGYCEYGMILSRQPGPEEWMEFYQDVRLALQAGMIELSDSVFLREIDNLKQARQMLVVREQIHRRKMMEEKQQDNQMAMEANRAAAADKFQYETSIMERQMQLEAELKQLQGKIDIMKQSQKAQMDGSAKQIGEEMKRVVEKQKGIDTIIKEGLRTRAQNYETDKAYDAKIYAANMKAQEKKEEPKKKK